MGVSMEENKCLNFMKGISCLTVVLLHCPLPGVVGAGIIYALRFPVPVFFMISGYFCYYRDTAWIKRAQMKILRLLVCSELFCGMVTFICDREGAAGQLKELALWSHPLRTLFCGTLFNATLWYLYAMLWTWLFMVLVKRKACIGRCYFFIPLILAVHIIGRLYIQETKDINVWIYLFRSPFLYGIPFVLSGHFLAEKREWINRHMSAFRCALLLIGGGFVMVAEYMVWKCFMDIWLSTVLITLSMFIFAMQHPGMEIFPVIARVGKKYSMIIYVSHIPFSRIMGKWVKPCVGEAVYGWIGPFLIMAAALLAAKGVDCYKLLSKNLKNS